MDPYSSAPRRARGPSALAGLVFIAVISGVQAPAPTSPAGAQEAAGAREPAPVDGIDVSHFNHDVDWAQVAAAGKRFAYIKATEGVDSADPSFEKNWRGAQAATLARGAYHFYVTEDDPQAQADFFIASVPCSDHGELIPVVDVEIVGHGTPSGWPQGLGRFLDLLEAHFGVRPMIYTEPNFWNARVGDAAAFGAYPLWVAEYGVDEPQVPKGWTSWTVWQHNDRATVPGIDVDTDLNRLAPGLDLDAVRLPAASEPQSAPTAPQPEASPSEVSPHDHR